jgi:glycosyltransferase involved in cell wall biosynthesis
MRAAVSCAFNENAIGALSRELWSRGMLATRLVPEWHLLADLAARVAHTRVAPSRLRGFVERKQARLQDGTLPVDVTVSRLTEPMRITGGRTRTPLTPYLGQYAWKAHFDGRVSGALDARGLDLVLGMPGSCRDTFRTHPGLFKVFHAIDTHPRARNVALRSVYGRRAWAETYPSVLCDRIEEELELADLVLAPSRLVAGQMVEHGIDPAKVTVQPYGVDLDRFRPWEEGPPQASRPSVLFVGQICLRKGVPLLLDAVRGLDLDVTLAGQVFDRSALRDLPPNVRLPGVLSADRLAAAFQEHDAMVLPTVDDACSLVVAEAAASGVPVITTSANGAAELLPPGHRVVPAGDVTALRDALATVQPLESTERHRLAEEARSPLGSGIRSWESYARGVVTMLGDRLGSRTARDR